MLKYYYDTLVLDYGEHFKKILLIILKINIL